MWDLFGACMLLPHFGAFEERGLHKVGSPQKVIYPSELAMYKAVTGLDLDERELIRTLDKTINLEKAYNVREGFTREDEAISEFWFKEPIPSGPQTGKLLDKVKFEKMKDEYYTLRGWDTETSWPTKETYERLGLSDVAKTLEKLGKLPKVKKQT